jgi:hypothetical protein
MKSAVEWLVHDLLSHSRQAFVRHENHGSIINASSEVVIGRCSNGTFFLILVCEAIGTAATPGPIVPASGDSEDDCGEADGM